MKKIFIGAIFFFVVSLVLLESCKKETDSSLKGNKWVESKDRADTIEFKGDLLYLNRGKEMINGSLRLKIYAGPYLYQEKKDSIALNPMVSSSSIFKIYAYKISDDKLYIGDFYQKTSVQNQTLVFQKLR